MSDHRIGLDLFNDVLDVLDRHGFARGDDEHAGRAIFSSGTWPVFTRARRTIRSVPPSTRLRPRRRHLSRPARTVVTRSPSRSAS